MIATESNAVQHCLRTLTLLRRVQRRHVVLPDTVARRGIDANYIILVPYIATVDVAGFDIRKLANCLAVWSSHPHLPDESAHELELVKVGLFLPAQPVDSHAPRRLQRIYVPEVQRGTAVRHDKFLRFGDVGHSPAYQGRQS